jgi:hypothetical protein
MSTEEKEKHDLKWFMLWVQSARTLITILGTVGGVVWWMGEELKDIHYAAKRTPVLERRIDTTNSNMKELSKFVNDSIISRIFTYSKYRKYGQ